MAAQLDKLVAFAELPSTVLQIAPFDLGERRGVVPVRDSKDPEGPALTFPADVFAAFVAGVKAGDFRAL
jgi:hypothetical protein